MSFKKINFRLLAQTTLRNILGTKNLHEILSDRNNIFNFGQENICEVIYSQIFKLKMT